MIPEIDFEAITPRKVPTVHHAFRGEVSRIVLTALRESRRPMTTTALTERVMKERGLDAENGPLRRVMSRRVGACLRGIGSGAWSDSLRSAGRSICGS